MTWFWKVTEMAILLKPIVRRKKWPIWVWTSKFQNILKTTTEPLLSCSVQKKGLKNLKLRKDTLLKSGGNANLKKAKWPP